MTHSFTIDRVLTDKRLLGAELGDGESWQTWRIALKGAFGLALTDAERVVFDAIAGGRNPPTQRVRELWCIVSRRAGKSKMAAALSVYFACFVKHKLSAGETGMVLTISPTTDTSKVVFNYVLGFMRKSPVLRHEIDSTTRNEIRLKNGIVIATHANSFRSVRGRTLCAVVLDEIAFFRDDTTATPDTEVYSAVLPALLTTNGMLVGISSPYRKLGFIYSEAQTFFGTDSDDTLVLQGRHARVQQDARRQRHRRPAAGRSRLRHAVEWDAEFRADISTFLDDKLIDAAVDHSRPLELPRASGISYKAFVDASGGAVGGDAYSHLHRATSATAVSSWTVCAVNVVRSILLRSPSDTSPSVATTASTLSPATVLPANGCGPAWQRDARPRMNYYDADLTASEMYLEMLAAVHTRSDRAARSSDAVA